MNKTEQRRALLRCYSSSEVCAHVGITNRQLQWWDEHRIVSPSWFQGHARRYKEEDLVLIQVIAKLKKIGLSLQAIRKVLPPIKAYLATRESPSFIVGYRGSVRVHFAATEHQAIETLLQIQQNPGSGGLFIAEI